VPQVELDGGASTGLRGGASGALLKMSQYPRRTMGGAAMGVAAMGGMAAGRRRGSQNYPMY
jgi:hypothetical protein